MEIIKCCNQETFQMLNKKAYRAIPRALLKTVLKELPDYASVVYLALYDLANANSRYPGTVVISHSALGEAVGKSESSIRRAIHQLKTWGYVELIQDGGLRKNYLPNIIRVSCPESIANKFLQEESDRKATIIQFPHKSALVQRPFKSPASTNMDYTCKPGTKEPPSAESLYKLYQQENQRLQHMGLSKFKAAEQAFSLFPAEQISILQQHLLGITSKTDPHFLPSLLSNLEGGVVKNDHHKNNNNNRDQDLLLTIGNLMSVDKSSTVKPPCISISNSVVGFKKKPVVVEPALTPADKTTIIKKLNAMYKAGEIHPQIIRHYQHDISRLIRECLFHIQHWQSNKLQTQKHALNACAKMLRQGIWATPKRFLHQQSVLREEEALWNKYQEVKEVKKFFKLQSNIKSL